MANRDINTMRDVTTVAADQPNAFIEVGAEMGQKLIMQGMEARMQNDLSKAQLELNQFDNEYRIKYEGDPTGGLEEYREGRQAIFEKYGENISPFMKGAWNESVAKLSTAADGKQEAWAFEQSYKNKVTYTNDTMENYLAQSALDGQSYGKNDSTQVEAFVNYGLAHQQLEQFGNTSLGSETTKKMLKDFQSDYIKTFVSGAVETNPQRGLKLLEDPRVQAAMKGDEWLKFKSATENRAKAVYRNQQEGGVLASVKASNGLLASGGKIGYAALQSADLTDDAREYFEGLNGFKGSGKRGGYSAEDKAGFKMGIYSAVTKLSNDKEADAASVRVVQDGIYRAMNAGALGQEEGLDLVQQIVEPLVKGKEKAMGDYGTYHPFADSIGFDGVDEWFDKNVALPAPEIATKTSKKAIEAQNLTAKANVYDFYYGALRARAGQAGVPVADVARLPKPQREKIYSEAQSEAQRLYMQNKFPALRTLPDTPNFVYSNGKLIQGAAGPRNVTPSAAAKATFSLKKDTDTGDVYRVYTNGTRELVQKGTK